jgi:hypothetical protein
MRRVLSMLVTTVLTLAAAACASGPSVWPPYQVVPIGPEGLPLPDPVVRIEREGARVEVEPLDGEERGDWLAARTGSDADPFARPGLGDRLLTFRVRVEAAGGGPLHFQPQNAALYRGQGRAPVLPLDYTRVFELLGARAGEPTDTPSEEVQAVMRGVWDSALTVPAGGSVEGLLIFPAPREFEPPLELALMLVRESTQVERLRVPLAPRVLGEAGEPPV